MSLITHLLSLRALPDECAVTDPSIVCAAIREYYLDLPPLVWVPFISLLFCVG